MPCGGHLDSEAEGETEGGVKDRLRRCSPLKDLSVPGFQRALEAGRELVFPADRVVFRQGERDPQVYFLLDGVVELRDGSGPPAGTRLTAGSGAACYPLSRLKPRRHTAVTHTEVRLFALDETGLDNLLTADQTAAYEVMEFSGDDPDWLFMLAGLPQFHRLPAANLVALFHHFQPLAVRRGQIIIRQGEVGDDYYLLRQGRAEVIRTRSRGEAAVLAVLGPGEAFGEEALLSGDPRNATVRMLSDGLLMRLPGAAFAELLQPVFVDWLSPSQVLSQLAAGAILLDVRLEDEYVRERRLGSINVPLYLLRVKMKALDRGRRYVCACNSGRRASVAAFLMGQRGYEVSVLQGNLDSLLPDERPTLRPDKG